MHEKDTNPFLGSDCIRRFELVAIYNVIFMSLDLNCSWVKGVMRGCGLLKWKNSVRNHYCWIGDIMNVIECSYCYCRLIEQECNLFHVLREEYHMISSGDTHVIDSGSLDCSVLGYFSILRGFFHFSKLLLIANQFNTHQKVY